MLAFDTKEFKSLVLFNDGFNLGEYFNLVKGLMSFENSSPFLLGRCALTLAKFIETEPCSQHVGDTMNVITGSFGADKSIILKAYAIKSIYEVCSNIKPIDNDRKVFIGTKLNVMLEGILNLLPESQSQLMAQCLEALSELLAFDANFTATAAQRVIPMVQALFLKYHDDRFLLENILEILKILSQNPFCQEALQEKIVPTIIKILNPLPMT